MECLTLVRFFCTNIDFFPLIGVLHPEVDVCAEPNYTSVSLPVSLSLSLAVRLLVRLSGFSRTHCFGRLQRIIKLLNFFRYS